MNNKEATKEVKENKENKETPQTKLGVYEEEDFFEEFDVEGKDYLII
jgi:hypothetical protein